jgi:SAM-dependent methyltransferase
MNEASKTRRVWTELELGILRGKGIDIGAGADPVLPGVRQFDREHGDANAISRHVAEQFDFVFSAHCLEHMHDPREAILEWWKLVRPGGHLFFIVPDEDLLRAGDVAVSLQSRSQGDVHVYQAHELVAGLGERHGSCGVAARW